MEEISKVKRPRYRLFSAGYEGGSIELYTDSLEDIAPVWEESSDMTFEANDDEIWVTRRVDYASFAAFWQAFSSQARWFYLRPLELHPLIRSYIQQSLDELTSQPNNDRNSVRNARFLHRWQQAVGKVEPGNPKE
jgi:hypothetical protein